MSEAYGAIKPDEELRTPFRDWLAEKWSSERPGLTGRELGECQLPKSGFSAKRL